MTTHHLATLQQAERALHIPATVTVSLPPGTGRDRAKQLVAALVTRHELLRSRLLPAPGGSRRLVQEVTDGAALSWRETGDPRCVTEGAVAAGSFRVELADAEGVEVRLSLPSSYVDMGGLLVLAAELQVLAAGQDLAEPVQNSQYAAWQADNEPAQPAVLPVPPPAVDGGRDVVVDADPAGPYERHGADLTHEQWAAVTGCARRLGVDVDAVLLAAWLIGQARRGESAVTGVYIDHRRAYEDLASTVGVLSRYLPFPAHVADGDVAEDVVRRVAKDLATTSALLDTFRWRDIPQGGYDCDSRAPRWPTLFGSYPVPSPAVLDRTTLVEPSHAPRLHLQVLYTDGAARVDLFRHPELVSASEASTLLDSYVAVLADIARQADRPVAELRMLTARAQQRVLADFGRSPEELPRTGDTAYHLIAAQVERTPDRVAVVAGDRQWTYAELHARAGQIAAAVVGAGLPADARVALLLERGVDLVAAVLGVWRAGMAYVPVDPGTPADRLAFILADSGAQVLLTDLRDAPQPTAEGPVVLRLADIATSAGAPPEGPHDASALAYVIYTSGTTGQPKGVMVEHHSVVNLARAHQARIYRHHDPAAAGLRVSLNAPLAFDGAVERILLLASGCTLFIADEETRRDPAAFVAFARRHDLQILDVTPSFLTALVQEDLLRQPGYRPAAVLVGGEAIRPTLWRTLAASPVAFYNVYGPTETTVNAAVGRVAGTDPHLGLALANVRLYILDPARQPVPPGVPGEIHVAGAGVGRGYLNRPELTARSFIVNPFAPDDPLLGRMYATGDIGRFNPDGSIDYLGRRDGQVKLRGFRIETDEIATLLSRDTDVTDALVHLIGEAPNQQLAAYVVAPERIHEGLAERLRKRLAEQLPAYMVPSLIMPLTAWPLTANGKVDVDALPVADGYRQAVPTDFVAPRTDVEAAVARLWSELLGREHIGATDNFFDIGGHSLLVPVMLRRLSEEFGVPLPLRTIFTAATVETLAEKVSGELSAR